MNIVLCDDHKIIADELTQLLNKFSETHNLSIDLLYFPKPSILYEHMQSNNVDLIFMDLEFCDATEDGILWLKKIKKQFPNTIVIILTAYENRYKEGFEARAFRFMTKPLSEQELFEYLQVSIDELHLTEAISVTRRGIVQNILLRDILYVSAHFGGSELWTKKDLHFCDESLLYWEERLPNTIFFRCHNKYLVNRKRLILGCT